MISAIGGISPNLQVTNYCVFLDWTSAIIFLFKPRRYKDIDDCPAQNRSSMYLTWASNSLYDFPVHTVQAEPSFGPTRMDKA
jgi:hypothetical protein